MRKMLVTIFYVSFIFKAAYALSDTGGIKGYIADSSGKPIFNAHVYVISTNRGDVSDVNGFFIIKFLPPGKYTIVIDHLTYKKRKIGGIKVLANQIVDLDTIKLDASVIEMESVIITATRTERKPVEISLPIDLVPKIKIQRLNVKSSAEALREEPNILIQKTSHAGGCAYIRGMGSNQILLLVDGIRMNNSIYRRGNHPYLTTIDFNMLDRIEVVRGPSSMLYGSDALGGTINTITKIPDLTRSGVSFDYRLAGRYASADNERSSRADFSIKSRRVAFQGGVSLKKFGDLRRGKCCSTGVLEKSPPLQSPSAFDCYDLDAKLLFSPKINQKIILASQYTKRSHIPRYDKYENNNYHLWEYNPQIRNLNYLRYEIGLNNRYISSLRATISYHYQEEGRRKQKHEDDQINQEKDNVGTIGVQLQLNSVIGSHLLTYGTDIYLDRIESVRYSIDPQTGEKEKKIQARYPDGAKYNSFGAFFQDEIGIGRKWTANIGIRYSYFYTNFSLPESVFDKAISQKFKSFTGSVGLIRNLGGGVFLNFNMRQAFRAPNLADISKLGESKGNIYEVPNPDLKPEKMISFDIGLKIESQRLRAETSIYYAKLNDLIDSDYDTYNGDSTIIRNGVEFIVKSKQNIGEAYFVGLESSMIYNFITNFYFNGNIAIPYGQNVTRHEPVGGVPPTFGRIGIQWERNSIYADLYIRFAAKQDRLSSDDKDDPRIPEGGTPGWYTLNLRLGYEIRNFGHVQFAIENILDRNYREHGSGINSAGRNIILSMQVSP